MGKKGLKSERGKGEEWNEPKTVRLSLKLTPTCKKLFQQQADSLGISISELLERTARGLVILPQEEDSRLPTLKQIDQVLPRLSASVLADIAIRVIGLMRGYFKQEDELTVTTNDTIAQLITNNWDKCVEELVGAIAATRLQDLADGAKPTQEELEPLSTVLPLSLDELEIIWRRDFKNGSKSGCANPY